MVLSASVAVPWLGRCQESLATWFEAGTPVAPEADRSRVVARHDSVNFGLVYKRNNYFLNHILTITTPSHYRKDAKMYVL